MWWAPKKEKRQALRTAALSQRNDLSEAICSRHSRSIQASALEFSHYCLSSAVALYSPVQNEVGTRDILVHALNHSKKVFYPRLGRDDAMDLVQVDSSAALAMGRFGILEPVGTHYLSGDEEGLIVFVPGVVFDLAGRRLGRGHGWYDRMLKRLRSGTIFVALAYEFQIVDEIPTEPWDQNVHYIISEKRVIDCGITFAQSSQILSRHP